MEVKNVEALFDDILNNDDEYYVGNLLITPSGDSSTEFDIVDGQQRITTISLYLLAIYYHLLRADNDDSKIKEFKSKEYKKKFNRALQDIPRRLINEDDNLASLQLLKKDQEIYDDLLNIAVTENLEYTPHKHGLMGKRYDEIINMINTEFLKNEGYTEDSIIKLIKFHDKILKMKFLIIAVEKVSDAFTIFTSFNAKGLPLTLIDLLKSFYLEKSVDKIGEKLSLDKWNRLLSYFLNSNGEANSTLVTQFLQNNFDTYQTEKTSSITKSKALDEYQKLFKNEGEQYIDHLLDQTMIFSSFTNNIGGYNDSLDYSDEMNNLLDKISKLEATSVYPVIMYALNEYRINKINQNDIEDILYFLVNYFVRRNITLKPKASNLRARGLAVVREMQSKEKNGSYLEIIKRNLIPLAADDELFMIALKGSVYDVNRDTTRLILIDIERNYGSFFDKNQIIDNLNDKNDNNKYYWTLEHIMPQKVKDNSDWEKMLESTRGDNDKDLHHEEYVHKLGNLTLTGYNSELRNSEFIKKKNYVNKKKWSVKDIDRRNNILSEHVLKLYPLD